MKNHFKVSITVLPVLRGVMSLRRNHGIFLVSFRKQPWMEWATHFTHLKASICSVRFSELDMEPLRRCAVEPWMSYSLPALTGLLFLPLSRRNSQAVVSNVGTRVKLEPLFPGWFHELILKSESVLQTVRTQGCVLGCRFPSHHLREAPCLSSYSWEEKYKTSRSP